MARASEEEIAELLGDRADESIVERVANVGASIDQVREALEDLDFELRFGEVREPLSAIIEEVRSILEELPHFDDLLDQTATHEDDDEHEGLTVIDELHD